MPVASKRLDWRKRPPRGWWLRGRYRRLTVWNVANVVLVLLIGVITGIWWFAIVVGGIWVMFFVVAFGLWTARRLDQRGN